MSSLAGAARLTIGAVWIGFTEGFWSAGAEDRCAPGRKGFSPAAVGVARLLAAADECDDVVGRNGPPAMTGSVAPRAGSIVLSAVGGAVVAEVIAIAVAPGTAWSLCDLRVHDLAISDSRMDPTNIAVYQTKRESRYRLRRVAPNETRAGGSLGIDASVSTESTKDDR